jgi:hypothetical protein
VNTAGGGSVAISFCRFALTREDACWNCAYPFSVARSRSRAPLTQAVLLLHALVGATAIATGCGHKHASPATPVSATRPSAYSILNVKKAFAAEGLPLTLESRYDGITDLRPTAWSLLGDLTVSVWPPAQASGTLLVIVQSGHHMVRVRNVDVDYALASPKTAKVLSAIARLRRMSPR